MKRPRTKVTDSFDVLIESIAKEIEAANNAGARAFQSGNYERIQDVLKRVAEIEAFKAKVAALREEWVGLGSEEASKLDDGNAGHRVRVRRSHRGLDRLDRGQRTPEETFFRPILETLEEAGGSARVAELLDQVFEKTKDVLKEVDFEVLESGDKRWRNTAQWARKKMVQQGLMESDSPHGVWEISEEGRRFIGKIE